MPTMFTMWEENVDKLWAMDCSSPTSASTRRNTFTRLSSETGICRPHWAMRVSRPMVLMVTVLPPVLGPVITRVSKSSPSIRSLATALSGSSRGWRAFRRYRPRSTILGAQARIR
ncbi:Uncharacterised protein [Flavonifractor plautii]|uniref:Uncharacterized protein n=1 Tax=Flavonifractor plautii TaxID=292800 RepID=A0A174P0C5_FLAPL|nr:Uncharacterised protein [Flavonifractor plautii]